MALIHQPLKLSQMPTLRSGDFRKNWSGLLRREVYKKKLRRTLQNCPTEVRLYSWQQPFLACSSAQSGSGCSSEWILFLASGATLTTSPGRPDADSSGLSKRVSTVIARSISICVIPGYTLWSEPGLPVDEACRKKSSGRVPEPTSTRPASWHPTGLQRQFNPNTPPERWVTDITCILTHEGWLYLAIVVDLFSRKVIGWSMQPRMTKDIVLNALLMAVRRRNPHRQVVVHTDQGSQYIIPEITRSG